MSNVRYVTAAAKALLVALWTPVVAYAATLQDMGVAFQFLTPQLAATLAAISTLAGVTAFTLRLSAMLNNTNPAPLPRPALFAVSHMLGTWLGGFFGLLLAMSTNTISATSALLVVGAASFLGSKAVEIIAMRVFPHAPAAALPSAAHATPNQGGDLDQQNA